MQLLKRVMQKNEKDGSFELLVALAINSAELQNQLSTDKDAFYNIGKEFVNVITEIK
jgi:hypothetical protein